MKEGSSSRTNDLVIAQGGDNMLPPSIEALATEEGDVYHRQETSRDTPIVGKPWYRPESLLSYVRTHDFLEIVGCIVFFFLLNSIYVFHVMPTERPIPYQYLEDTNSYVRNLVNDAPYDGYETVPNAWLLILSQILPLVLQFVLAKCWGRRGDAHCAVCVYFVSLGITLFVTQVVKLYCGYLRPNFYSVCDPSDNYQNCNEDSEDVRVSFPSGHASTSFCGLMLLTLYIHNRFGVPSVTVILPKQIVKDDNTVERHLLIAYSSPSQTPMLPRFISILALLPLGVAIFIASSRVVDNKHFPADVVGGAVLGSAVSLYINNLWYHFTPTIILE